MALVPQHRTPSLALMALAVAVLVAFATPAPVEAGHGTAEPYFDLGALPEPALSGKALVDGLDAFADAFPYRLTGGPTEIAAGEALRAEVAALGYETAVVPLPVTGGVAASPLKAVTALKRGTTLPDEWILFVGHYDTVPQTIWGTYDNAAGTSMMRYLAHELADVPTNRSIAFAWYNGEEQGLLASARHAAALKASGQKIAAVLGFDMVGVAWPVHPSSEQAASCLCMFHGPGDAATLRPLLEHVNFEFLGYPRDPRKVVVVGTNTRNSDERSFAQQGYPTMRWAGMRTAASYPAYHLPDDTLETMISVAGGREFVEAGTRNTLRSAYYTALAVDNHPPAAAIDVRVDGLTVVVDGSASTDRDGQLSGFAWRLGDGGTASGPTATHTFAAPGTYEVTLEVADNLWPSVTVERTVQVAVG
jgi:hypothetical protein